MCLAHVVLTCDSLALGAWTSTPKGEFNIWVRIRISNFLASCLALSRARQIITRYLGLGRARRLVVWAMIVSMGRVRRSRALEHMMLDVGVTMVERVTRNGQRSSSLVGSTAVG